MTSRCRDIESSIGRPAHTLSEAERLVLEQHLADCAACRHDNALSRSVIELVTSAPSGLSAAARERAILGAFEPQARARRSRRPATRRRLQLGLSLVAAAAAILGLRLSLVSAPERTPLSASEGTPTRAVESIVAARPAEAAYEAPTSHAIVPPPEQPVPAASEPWVEVARAERRVFAHAQVALGAHARVRFDRAHSALELARGRIDVDVDEAPGRPFAVVTQNFRVQVLGTQFVVTPERVDVVRGKVQVTTLEGAPLGAPLSAGQSYRHRPSVPAKARGDDARGEGAASKPAPSPPPSSAELLAAARKSLARADVASARATLQEIDPQASSLAERAEADTLRAECALLARQPADAIAAYLVVAERYPALPAAQNALFAAAQLRERNADASGARALFERYLARYPQGRFADEARARLAKVAR